MEEILIGVYMTTRRKWWRLWKPGAYPFIKDPWLQLRFLSNWNPLNIRKNRFCSFGPVRGRSNCPVEALLRYLEARPSTGGPLFVTREGKPLLRAKIAKISKACIVNCGLEPEFYNTHSFRAGRASDLALAGGTRRGDLFYGAMVL